MGYGRAYLRGELPEEIYVVSFGNSHKIYSKLSSARGVVTTSGRWGVLDGYPKIFKLTIGGIEEIK